MAGRFKDYVYNPAFLADKYEEDIGNIDRSAIRADYSYMRKLAQQRLKRFEGTEWVKSATYRFNKNRFKKLDEIKSVDELAHLIVEVRNFLNKPTSSVRGQTRTRDARIETLHEHGFEFVNKNNFNQFVQFMDRMRALNLSKIYDSEQAAEIWNELAKSGATPDEVAEAFKQFTEKELGKPEVRRNESVSSDRIREIWRKNRKT